MNYSRPITFKSTDGTEVTFDLPSTKIDSVTGKPLQAHPSLTLEVVSRNGEGESVGTHTETVDLADVTSIELGVQS
jgi:hypothetical protein